MSADWARARDAVVERRPVLGDLAFWAAVGVATILCILALARPVARVSVIRRASADIVVLLDGSASMHVTDIARTLETVRAVPAGLW